MTLTPTKINAFSILLLTVCLGVCSCRRDSHDNDETGAGDVSAPIINNLLVFPADVSVTVGASVSFYAETTAGDLVKSDVTSYVIWSVDPASELFEQNADLPFIFKAATPGESYIYAVSKEGTIAKAKVTVFEVEAEVPPTVLTNPTGLLATSDLTSSIVLDWTAAVGITQHQIAYLPGAIAPETCQTGIIVSPSLIGALATYEIGGLSTNSEYSFRLCSTDDEGNLSSGIEITHTTAANHRLFVSAGSWNGLAVGGILGADDKCQLEADLYGLTGGTWKAILSGSGVGESALARININRPIYNTRDSSLGGPQLVAIDALDLWDSAISNAARYQADGTQSAGTLVWSGTGADGSFTGANCSDWSSTAGSGGRALNSSVTPTWIANATSTCATLNRLYCIDGQ